MTHFSTIKGTSGAVEGSSFSEQHGCDPRPSLSAFNLRVFPDGWAHVKPGLSTVQARRPPPTGRAHLPAGWAARAWAETAVRAPAGRAGEEG